MKTQLCLTMMAMSIIVMSMTSCKDEDNDAAPKSYFKLNNTNAALKSAHYTGSSVAMFNSASPIYLNYLNLFSDGFKTGNGLDGMGIPGKGTRFDLDITGSSGELAEGTYTFKTGTYHWTTAAPGIATFMFWGSAKVYTTGDNQVNRPDQAFMLTSGTLTVTKKDANNWIIHLTGTLREAIYDLDGSFNYEPNLLKSEIPIEAHFEGTL